MNMSFFWQSRLTGRTGRRRGQKIATLLAVAIVAVVACGGGAGDSDGDFDATVTALRSSRDRAISDHGSTSSVSSRETPGSESASHAADIVVDHGSTADDLPLAVAVSDDAGHSAPAATSLETVAVSHDTTTAPDSGHAPAAPASGHDAEPAQEGHGGAVHWDYAGRTGPDYWGDLSLDYTTCIDGSAQSPIDIKEPRLADLEDIRFHYNPALLTVVNNGHTIQANYGRTDQGDGGSMVVGGREYELLQFHYHRPSEHTVNGHQAAMEMHLVHKDADGGLAVIGVLLEPGAYNEAFAPIWDVMPSTADTEVTMHGLFDINDLLPQDRRTFRYPGSLTTPPCSEGVQWLLMKTPVSVSTTQVDAFKNLYFYNARYTQPLDGREILEDVSVGQ